MRIPYGGVAQLARAFGSYPECHVFESHRRYQEKAGFYLAFFVVQTKYIGSSKFVLATFLHFAWQQILRNVLFFKSYSNCPRLSANMNTRHTA